MLVMGRVVPTLDAARERLDRAIRDGSAREVARRMVAAQGGDPAVVDDPSRLPRTKSREPVRASRAGFVASIDTHAIGLAGIGLGAGRTRTDDVIDPAVGFVFEKSVGDRVAAGDVIAWVHSDDAARAREAIDRVGAAVAIADAAPAEVPMVLDRVEG
jgi:thymidine phosphorylase